MKHSAQVYLHDIQEAGQHIQEFTKKMSLKDYGNSALVKAAAERKFAVIGEALVRLKREFPELLEQISDTEQIISFRNVLVHGYDVIDDATVWAAIKDSLPILITEIQTLLGS